MVFAFIHFFCIKCIHIITKYTWHCYEKKDSLFMSVKNRNCTRGNPMVLPQINLKIYTKTCLFSLNGTLLANLSDRKVKHNLVVCASGENYQQENIKLMNYPKIHFAFDLCIFITLSNAKDECFRESPVHLTCW